MISRQTVSATGREALSPVVNSNFFTCFTFPSMKATARRDRHYPSICHTHPQSVTAPQYRPAMLRCLSKHPSRCRHTSGTVPTHTATPKPIACIQMYRPASLWQHPLRQYEYQKHHRHDDPERQADAYVYPNQFFHGAASGIVSVNLTTFSVLIQPASSAASNERRMRSAGMPR